MPGAIGGMGVVPSDSGVPLDNRYSDVVLRLGTRYEAA